MQWKKGSCCFGASKNPEFPVEGPLEGSALFDSVNSDSVDDAKPHHASGSDPV